MSFGTHARDPVDGTAYFFTDEKDSARLAWLHWELAARYWITIKEAYRMVRVAVFGLMALDDEFNPDKELEKLGRQAEQDHELLKLPLPLDEAMAIWERSRDLLRMIAAINPRKRAQIKAFLAEQDAVMAGLLEQWQCQ